MYYFPGPLEESAIWIEELPPEDILQRGSHSVAQTSGYQDPLGVIKEQTRYSLEAKLSTCFTVSVHNILINTNKLYVLVCCFCRKKQVEESVDEFYPEGNDYRTLGQHDLI